MDYIYSTEYPQIMLLELQHERGEIDIALHDQS